MNWGPAQPFLLANNACFEPHFPVTLFETVYIPQSPYYYEPCLFYVPWAFSHPCNAATDPNCPPPYSTLPINLSSMQPPIYPPVCTLPPQSPQIILENFPQRPVHRHQSDAMPKYFDPSNAPLLTHLLNLKAQDVRRMNKRRKRSQAVFVNQQEEVMPGIKEQIVEEDPFIICKLMAPKKVKRPISIYQFAKRCKVSLESIIASSLVSSPLAAQAKKLHSSNSSKLPRRKRGRPKSTPAFPQVEAPLKEIPEPMDEEMELGEEQGQGDEEDFLFEDLEFDEMEQSHMDEGNEQ